MRQLLIQSRLDKHVGLKFEKPPVKLEVDYTTNNRTLKGFNPFRVVVA